MYSEMISIAANAAVKVMTLWAVVRIIQSIISNIAVVKAAKQAGKRFLNER